MRFAGQSFVGLLIILISIQVFRNDKNISTADDPRDITAHHPATPEIKTLLQNACYDCHSNNTRYPWYAEIQPIGWWLARHIRDGKKHLNFSTFADYSAAKASSKLDGSIDEIAEGEMPPPAYRRIHDEARLTPQQIKLLSDWFAAVRDRVDPPVSP